MKQNIQRLSYQDLTKEEIKKIKKRMSIPFIKEYINYINARNRYNDKPHTVQELKQKVIDYAKYANVDPEDSKKIRNNHISAADIENSVAEDIEKHFEDKKYEVLAGGGCNSRVAKKKKSLIGLETKNDKNIAIAINKFNNEKKPYDTDVITTSAILSLIERQPKYYSKNAMSFVDAYDIMKDGGGREDVLSKISDTGLAKYNVRLFFMPLVDEGFKNCFYIGAKYNDGELTHFDRLSRIDLENCFCHPMFITSPAIMISNVLDPNVIDNRNFKIGDKEKFSQELKKNLCITPELIEYCVRQHLYNIGERKEIIDKRVKQAVRAHLDLLQSLNAVGHFFVKEQYNEAKKEDFSSQDIYTENINSLKELREKLKDDNNTNFSHNKENLTLILKDKDLSNKIKTAIFSFKNYLYLQEKINKHNKKKEDINKKQNKIKKIRNRKVDYSKYLGEKGWIR